MEKLYEILEGIRPDVDFKKEDDLVSSGILDSIKIVELVGEINDEFDIDISPVYIIPENFKNAKTIYELIEKVIEEDE